MTMNNEYHSSAHCKYLTQYHIIWCPKYRYPVLTPERQNRLRTILTEICYKYRYNIKALEIMPDHIHIFVDIPQTVAPSDAVRTLKSISAVRMLQDDPSLRQFYSRCGVLWSKGHFVSSVGQVSAATVQKYIEEQKHAETKD